MQLFTLEVTLWALTSVLPGIQLSQLGHLWASFSRAGILVVSRIYFFKSHKGSTKKELTRNRPNSRPAETDPYVFDAWHYANSHNVFTTWPASWWGFRFHKSVTKRQVKSRSLDLELFAANRWDWLRYFPIKSEVEQQQKPHLSERSTSLNSYLLRQCPPIVV